MKVAVWITDKRMKQIAKRLTEGGFDVSTIEDHAQIEEAFKDADTFDIVVLPINGIDELGRISIHDQKIDLSNHVAKWKRGVHLYTGVNTAFLKQLELKVIALMEMEEVVTSNAKLTAEGILYMMIQYTPYSIFDYQVDVIGYGHCGKEIVKLLKMLKIKTRIISSQNLNKSDSFLTSCSMQQWRTVQPYPLIINTAPECVIDLELANTWSFQPLIFDLASKGVGVDKQVVDAKKASVYQAPPLPGLIACQAAGDILAKQIMKEEKQ